MRPYQGKRGFASSRTQSRCALFGVLIQIWLALSTAARAQQGTSTLSKPTSGEESKLSDAITVSVRKFRFQGNIVFSSNELAKVVAPYVNREINSGELEDARRALTLLYVTNGFINSGALLEDQPAQGGVITFRIVEGKLSEIDVEGNRWLRSSYIRKRIRRGAGEPLNINKLRAALLLIKDNPNLKRINAELKPGTDRGESILDLKVEEVSPLHFGLQARNDRPPSVGGEIIELLTLVPNLTGNSDALDFRYGLAERTKDSMKFSGVDNLGASYRFPLNRYETTLQLAYTRDDFAIVEAPFNSLDIQSHSDSYSLGLRQPIYRTPTREFSFTLLAERRHSESFLLGEPFSFSPGAVNGEVTVSVLRFVNEWVARSQTQVISLRSTFSLGLDVLDATQNGTSRNGQFVAWLGQAQFVRRLFDTANELVLSSSFQWADSPLLSLEQFPIGGANTVRGYRENQLVRDMGALASAEVRLPLLFNKTGGAVLRLAPFFDFGTGWNVDSPTPRPDNIMSAGAGLIFSPSAKFYAQLYWGYAFREIKTSGHDAQDLGLHFKVNCWVF